MLVEGRESRFCVLGASLLTLMGFEVDLYNRMEERLWPIQQRGGIELTGEVEDFRRIGRG